MRRGGGIWMKNEVVGGGVNVERKLGGFKDILERLKGGW